MLKLIEMLDKFSHQIEEKDETISELQTLLKFRTNENKSLYKENNRLHEVIKIKDSERIDLVKESTTLKNDYKKCYAENIRLSEENNQLKLRNKMLTKIGLNSVYGIHCHCCKNHCVYTDTDSIKTESEDK